MKGNIALVGMCDKDFVDEIIDEIRNREARTQILWTNAIRPEVREDLEKQIRENHYARLFMYEKTSSGSQGIRVAAHFDGFEDVLVKNCYNGKPCKTRFRVKGYEILENTVAISQFSDYETGDAVKATQGLGKSFAYVRNPSGLVGRDLTTFANLVWNTDSWQAPSGSFENPKEESYYATHGFGHEEWNFRTEHAMNGAMYGFMMGRPVDRERLGLPKDAKYPTYFYSQENDRTYLVGAYLEGEPVTDSAETDRLLEYHTKEGIISERVDEVYPLVEDRAVFGKTRNFNQLSEDKKRELIARELGSEGYEPKRYLKCPAEKTVLPPEPIEIDAYLKSIMEGIRGFGKFYVPIYLPVYPVILNKLGGPVDSDFPVDADEIERALQEARSRKGGGSTQPHDASYVEYTIRAQTGEYRRKEFELVNRFRSWLEREHSVGTLKEADYVDVVFEIGTASYGVEAKYSNGKMRFPIRRALGQILEYNFYPRRTPKDQWIILLNRRPNKEERKWFSQLNIGVPVTICWEKDSSFEFNRVPF